MATHPIPDRTDAVLADFAEQCPRPDARQIREWVARHPEHAQDIVILAAIMIAEEVNGAPRVVPTAPHEVSRVEAGEPGEQAPGAVPATLDDLLRLAGLDVPELARRTGMRREVLSKLRTGLLELPIRGPLLPRIADAIGVDPATVQAAATASLATPLALHARARGLPTTTRQSYAAALEASGMPKAERDAWLAED